MHGSGLRSSMHEVDGLIMSCKTPHDSCEMHQVRRRYPFSVPTQD
jgi:hypothetical protein